MKIPQVNTSKFVEFLYVTTGIFDLYIRLYANIMINIYLIYLQYIIWVCVGDCACECAIWD